jgi:hypothetical protein
MMRGAVSRLNWRRAVIALMAVLVLAQTLGFMHRSLHSPLTETGHIRHTTAHESAHQHGEHQDNQTALHWVGQLFAHHSDDSVCRLLDAQTSVEGIFSAPALVLLAQAATDLIAFSQITSTARAAALFEARGPPSTL